MKQEPGIKLEADTWAEDQLQPQTGLLPKQEPGLQGNVKLEPGLAAAVKQEPGTAGTVQQEPEVGGLAGLGSYGSNSD